MLRGGLQDGHQALHEDPIVGRRAGAAAVHDGSGHLIREQRGPMIGLLGAHRPAVDGMKPPDPPLLLQQPPLRVHVVERRDERRPVGVVGRAAREPVPEHVRDDDEPALRIEDTVGADQPLQVHVLGGVAGGVEDHVVASGSERPVRPPRQVCSGQHVSGLERQLPDIEAAGSGRPACHGISPVRERGGTRRLTSTGLSGPAMLDMRMPIPSDLQPGPRYCTMPFRLKRPHRSGDHE